MTEDFDPVDALSILIAELLCDKNPRSLSAALAVTRVRLGLGLNPQADRETVKAALGKALGKPASTPAAPSLVDRVTSALLGANFRQYGNDAATLPAFLVADGVGVTVRVAWEAANDEWRGRLLAKLAASLRRDGFEVQDRDGYLYIPEQETTTEAATGTVAR
jgi:hypothetical protein